jgi:hypothetical protein
MELPNAVPVILNAFNHKCASFCEAEEWTESRKLWLWHPQFMSFMQEEFGAGFQDDSSDCDPRSIASISCGSLSSRWPSP